MNREETLTWIEDVLDALDKSEVIAMINEAIDANQASPEFFEALDSERERYKAEGDLRTSQQLTEIAATIASVRQNRKEKL
jgi:flagellar biosynthesis regulator FlbT